MMGTFSNAFRQIKDKIVPEFKQKICCIPGATILESINKYRDYLQTNCGVMDTLISVTTMASDFLTDRALETEVVITDTLADFAAIPDELKTLAVDGLAEVCHAGKDEISKAGVTITDSAGHAYNIVDQRSEELVFDGKQVLFSMTYTVSNIQEAIIYQDATGHLYINNAIRTADFVKNSGRRVEPETCFELLQSINVICGNSTVGTTILKQLENYCGSQVSNIHTKLVQLAGVDGSILDLLSILWNRENAAHPLQVGGYVNSIWNVINDLVESASLNSVLMSTCDAILGGLNNGVAVSAVVNECLLSKYKSIRSFGSGIAAAFNRGGVYGLGCYIVSYLKELCEARVDDGTLQFTDNSRLCPKIYIAGVIQTIATGIGTVLSMIIAVFKPIVGAAFALIGSVTNQLFSLINYDYSSTNAAINPSDKVIIPISPYGVCQTEVTFNLDKVGSEVYDLINQGASLLYALIPGAYILIGPGSFTDDGRVSTLKYELHPIVCDCREYFDILSEYLLVEHKVRYKAEQGPGGPADINVYLYLVLNQNERRIVATDILNNYSALSKDIVIENQDNDRLSNEDDALVLKLVLENLFIAGLYLSCLTTLNFFNGINFIEPTRAGTDFFYGATNNTGNHLGFWYGLVSFCQNHEIMCYDDSPLSGGFYIGGYGGYDRTPTWLTTYSISIDEIVSAGSSIAIPSLISGQDLGYEIGVQKFYDNVVSFNATLEPALYVPSYDKKSFWANVVASAIITTVVATAVAITVYSARRAIAKRRAFNQASVSSAYEAFVENPNDANYDAYRKAVTRNNTWASLIGGTKYDYVNYWNADPTESAEQGSASGTVYNLLTDTSLLGGSKLPVTNSETVLTQATSQKAIVDLDSVIRLITI